VLAGLLGVRTLARIRNNWVLMRATILPAREVREVDARTVADLLKALGLHRDAHLVVRGEDILTADVRLTPADEVEVWPVISGGA
jgi:sulfur carrier protein ThiS